MANKWNYKHGTYAYPPSMITPFLINAPDDNVRGNVCYCNSSHPNASDTDVNRGSANIPYITLNKWVADNYTGTLIVAPGTYANTGSVSLINKMFIADSLFTVVITNCVVRGAFIGCILTISSSVNTANSVSSRCIVESPLLTNFVCRESLFLLGTYSLHTKSHSVYISQLIPDIGVYDLYSLFFNCNITRTTAANLYNRVFWLGTLNLGIYTSDLNDICARIDNNTITENEGIAEVEVDLNLAVNTLKNNGFRLLNPHFINVAKGNFNIDYLNYDCTQILGRRDAWNWIINRGVRCEYPIDFVGDSGFGETPDINDGFNGDLKCYNIDSAGSITDLANDTVIVTKKYILPTVQTLERVNFFDKLINNIITFTGVVNDGTNTPNLYTYYLLGSYGTLETEYNSLNYTFSYSSGILTTNFLEFMFGRENKTNRENNALLGIWENGNLNLDEARNIYNTGVKEFRLIAVKKGV